MKLRVLLLVILSISFLAGCAGNPNSSQARRCEAQLDIAERTLKVVKAKRARGHINVTKAASLIAAARIQQEFGKYPNCLDKAKRARAYLSRVN